MMIIAFLKPSIVQQITKKEWSRKRIAVVGVVTFLVGTTGLGSVMDATMPASIRAEIAAQEKAEAAARAQQTQQSQVTKKQVSPKKLAVKIETVTSSIPFVSSEKEDPALSKGQRKTTTTGVNGEKVDTYEITYVNGKQTDRKLTKSTVTKEPIGEVVSIGTYIAQTSAPDSTYSTSAPSQATSAYYANCSEARAAGVAPIYQGQPGYRSGLDRDHDGIACDV